MTQDEKKQNIHRLVDKIFAVSEVGNYGAVLEITKSDVFTGNAVIVLNHETSADSIVFLFLEAALTITKHGVPENMKPEALYDTVTKEEKSWEGPTL